MPKVSLGKKDKSQRKLQLFPRTIKFFIWNFQIYFQFILKLQITPEKPHYFTLAKWTLFA